MDKIAFGGGILLLTAGGILCRETFVWLWGRFLDAVAAGMGKRVTWESFPWLNLLGLFLMGVGLWLIFRPSDKEEAPDRLARLAETMMRLSATLSVALQGAFKPSASTLGEIASVYHSLDKLGVSTPDQWSGEEVSGLDQYEAYRHANTFGLRSCR